MQRNRNCCYLEFREKSWFFNPVRNSFFTAGVLLRKSLTGRESLGKGQPPFLCSSLSHRICSDSLGLLYIQATSKRNHSPLQPLACPLLHCLSLSSSHALLPFPLTPTGWLSLHAFPLLIRLEPAQWTGLHSGTSLFTSLLLSNFLPTVAISSHDLPLLYLRLFPTQGQIHLRWTPLHVP